MVRPRLGDANPLPRPLCSAKPVELGATNLERIERLSGAVNRLIMRYRDLPNYPDCQHLKAVIWREYQETLAELMEAIHG